MDLKLDHLVKVISPEGRVLQGRVRYVGPVPGREDAHVGVELPYFNGSSDGTFHGRRFFDCEPNRAIFVPFKKVVLAWCTTWPEIPVPVVTTPRILLSQYTM